MIKDVEPLLKECEETLAELKKMGNMEVACYVQGFINSINKLPEVERGNGEWIPYPERLPEEQGQYYVSGGNKVWICDFLIFSNSKGGWCNNVSNPVVEAWMPLPEPYKKEGERNETN